MPFLAAEGLLRLTHVAAPSSYDDPYVAFSESFPLFELDASEGVYRIAKHHHYFFGQAQFPAAKSADTFRAFCLGGSTVLGHPYETPTSFPKWIEIELDARHPQREHEIVNCGGMSYASYRLIPILQEVLSYQPDLIVVMTGHNEFLEDRTYRDLKQRSTAQKWVDEAAAASRLVTLGRRAVASLQEETELRKTVLPVEVDARLDHNSGYSSYRRDETWWNDVAEHHALNLQVMTELCAQANVPLLLVNPGSNLRDCPPFKSQNKSKLSPRDFSRWQTLFSEGEELEDAELTKALACYKEANTIDDQHALLAYRIARVLDQLNRTQEASTFYERAKELDTCPLRMLDVMEQNLFKVAEATATPAINVPDILKSDDPNVPVGSDWYVDHVHPSIHGHQLIAQAAVEKLIQEGIISTPVPWSNMDRRLAYRQHMTNHGEKYLHEGRRRVEWLEDWARRDLLREDTIPLGNRGMLDYGHIATEFGEHEQAANVYAMVLNSDPDASQKILDRALQLFRSGRTTTAEMLVADLASWSRAVSIGDDLHVAMAVLALDSGDRELADSYAAIVEADVAELSAMALNWLEELPETKSVFKLEQQ